MHVRSQILADIRTALEDAAPMGVSVLDENQTCPGAPSIQVAFVREVPAGGDSSRDRIARRLGFTVTATGRTPAERDELCELIEDAICDDALSFGYAIELDFAGATLALAAAESGNRVAPCVMEFEAQYATRRGTSGETA
jgi:hypothetical protein